MEEKILQCPHCPSDKSPKLYVNTEKGVFNCFRCGFKGSIESLYKYPHLLSQIEYNASVSSLFKYKQFGTHQDLNTNDPLKEIAPSRFIQETDKEYQYLISRGWSHYHIINNNVMVSGNIRFLNRVILPILNKDNELIYFTARSIDPNNSFRYINSKSSKKGILYYSNLAETALYPHDAFICEGIFDAFKLPNSVALLGKILPKDTEAALIAKLKPYKNIFICLDKGELEENAMKSLADQLVDWFPNKNIFMLDGSKFPENHKDLGDLSKVMNSNELVSFVKQNSFKYVRSETLTSKLKNKFSLAVLL